MVNEDHVLRLLSDVVGPENVSNDEAILIAYSRDQHWPIVSPHMPDYVVRPKTTEEVQKILRIANRYRIPVVPMSSGINVRGLCVPTHGGIVLELKRMDRIIEINEEMMTATVEPGVTVAKLSVEAAKKGLRPSIPGAPATVCVLSNFMLRGVYHQIASDGIDQVLSMEVVLPNGEILYTGSAAFPNVGPYFRYFGPDLTGLFQGQPGTMGVVTKMTVKLYKLPEVSEILINNFNDLDRAIEFTRTIVEEEIAAIHIILHWIDLLITQGMIRSKEDVQKLEKIIPHWFTLTVFEGKKEKVEYCKKVAERILKQYPPVVEIPGFPIGTIEPVSPDMGLHEFRYPRNIANWFTFGGYWALACWGPLNKLSAYYNEGLKIWKKYGFDPEAMPLVAYPVFPFKGQNCYIEFSAFSDSTDPEIADNLRAYYKELAEKLLNIGIYAWFRPYLDVIQFTMPKLKGKYVDLWRELKKLLDPNNIMNPGKLFEE